MFKSLKAKIMITTFVLISLSLIGFTILVINQIKVSVQKQLEMDTGVLISTIQREVRNQSNNDLNRIKTIFQEIKKNSEENISYISLSDNEGNILVSDTFISGSKDSKTLESEILSKDKTGEKLHHMSSLFLFDSNQSSKLNIGISLNNMNDQVKTITIYILLLAAVLEIFSLFFMFIFARIFITNPLESVIQKLSNGSKQVSTASSQISSASQQLADGSGDQAAAIMEISATMDETSSVVARNSEITQHAADLSNEAKIATEKGNLKMKDLNVAMEEIKNSSDNIAQIIKVIDEIAFQTNLLSINAAIEAARVGKVGKGFAVVADAVRNLAKRSAQAVSESTDIIESNIALSKKSLQINMEVSRSLNDINEKVDNMNRIISEIFNTSEVQTKGIAQIIKAIDQVEQVTQNNAATSEETAAASSELYTQVSDLHNVVVSLSQFINGSKTEENLLQSSHVKKNSLMTSYIKDAINLLYYRIRNKKRK